MGMIGRETPVHETSDPNMVSHKEYRITFFFIQFDQKNTHVQF